MPPFVWRLPNRTLESRRPLVMGIVNITPDSFSDGGRFFNPNDAIAHGVRLVAEGADLLDIGGESTRPGSQPVPLEEELRRVVPVAKALSAQCNVPISVDTSKAELARRCLDEGASIINDVTALRGDPEMPELIRRSKAGAILMHMQGTPPTMQVDPKYTDVVAEVFQFLEQRVRELGDLGIAPEQLAVDPGIGFGKRHVHNLHLLNGLPRFQELGRPVCLGVSRKGFIGKITGRTVAESMVGSVAVVCDAVSHGAAQIVRVHDVGPTVEALAMIEAIREISTSTM